MRPPCTRNCLSTPCPSISSSAPGCTAVGSRAGDKPEKQRGRRNRRPLQELGCGGTIRSRPSSGAATITQRSPWMFHPPHANRARRPILTSWRPQVPPAGSRARFSNRRIERGAATSRSCGSVEGGGAVVELAQCESEGPDCARKTSGRRDSSRRSTTGFTAA